MTVNNNDDVLNYFRVNPDASKATQVELYMAKRLFLEHNPAERIHNYSILVHVDNGNVPDKWPSTASTWAEVNSDPSKLVYRTTPDHWMPFTGNYIHSIDF